MFVRCSLSFPCCKLLGRLKASDSGPKAELEGLLSKYGGNLVRAIFEGVVDDPEHGKCKYADYHHLYRFVSLEDASSGIDAEQEWFTKTEQRGNTLQKLQCADCRRSFNKGGALPNMRKQFRFYAQVMWGRKLAYVPDADKPKSRPNLRRCVHCRHKEIMQQTEVHHLMIMCCQTTILIMPASCF